MLGGTETADIRAFVTVKQRYIKLRTPEIYTILVIRFTKILVFVIERNAILLSGVKLSWYIGSLKRERG